MIKKEAPTDELFKQAAKDGMTTLIQDGIHKIFQGLTDLDEIRRVCVT
jgi:type II secretory ATPase GspE/PulE/Tfp pilus assembly ATPase PilB-like protein